MAESIANILLNKLSLPIIHLRDDDDDVVENFRGSLGYKCANKYHKNTKCTDMN